MNNPSTLTDLFAQILQSEQKAEKRKSLLNTTKGEIADCQEKIKEKQNEEKQLHGQLVVKLQQLNNEELDLKWLTVREQILTQQTQTVTEDIHGTKTQLETFRKTLDREREKFCVEAATFSRSYDLKGTGKRIRVADRRTELSRLRQEEEDLLKELAHYNEQKEMVLCVKVEQEELKEKLRKDKEELAVLQKELDSRKNKTTALEMEKKRVSSLPHNGTAFIKLQSELAAAKDNTIEDMCTALQQELQDLKQLQWQRTLQQRKHPSRKPPEATVLHNEVPPRRNVTVVTNFNPNTMNAHVCGRI